MLVRALARAARAVWLSLIKGEDRLDGGAGSDLVSYADLMSSNQAVTVDLVIQRAFGAGGNDTLVSVEGALTGAGNDSVLGDALANRLASGSGNDTIAASGGNDTVNGGFGEDSINGGAGVDLLSVPIRRVFQLPTSSF